MVDSMVPPIFPFQAADQVETLFDFLQPFGVELDDFKVIAQAACQVGQGFFQRDGLFRQGVLRPINLG